MVYTYEGAAIECNAAKVTTRDLIPGSFIEILNVGRCKKYNCKRNSSTQIIKESDPKKRIYFPNPHLDLHDKLEGEEIVLFVNSVKPLKHKVVNETGRHKAQEAQASNFTLAQIKMQFHFQKTINDPRQLEAQSVTAKAIESITTPS